MAREPIDLRRDYFVTLRDEIKATKARIFALMVLGLIGSPVLTYFVLVSGSYVFKLVAPMVVLLVLVLYLSEQTMLMRAARYIRKNIESEEGEWEHWVGGLKLRSAEQQLFAMFMIVGLFFYTILTVLAMTDPHIVEMRHVSTFSFEYFFWLYGVTGFYVLATLWGLGTLVRFWKAAITTGNGNG